jgi:hypothetical protein
VQRLIYVRFRFFDFYSENFFIRIDILKHLLTDQTKHEFVMEVTDKTRADVKVFNKNTFLNENF